MFYALLIYNLDISSIYYNKKKFTKIMCKPLNTRWPTLGFDYWTNKI